MIKTITSSTNPLVQRAIKLHSAKYRAHYKEFIAEGLHVIETLIETQNAPITIFTTEKQLSTVQKLVAEKKIILIPETLNVKISTLESPSGIIAIFPIPLQPSYNKLSSGIVLVDIQNPGNAGTLLRTAVAMNKKTAVFVNGVDPWSPKVVQASAGAIGLITIFQLTWDELVKHKGAFSLCALIVSGGDDPQNINIQNDLIVVGNEGQGLSQEQIDQCDKKITLSMPGNFESLNAAIAGSIALYLSK